MSGVFVGFGEAVAVGLGAGRGVGVAVEVAAGLGVTVGSGEGVGLGGGTLVAVGSGVLAGEGVVRSAIVAVGALVGDGTGDAVGVALGVGAWPPGVEGTWQAASSIATTESASGPVNAANLLMEPLEVGEARDRAWVPGHGLGLILHPPGWPGQCLLGQSPGVRAQAEAPSSKRRWRSFHASPLGIERRSPCHGVCLVMQHGYGPPRTAYIGGMRAFLLLGGLAVAGAGLAFGASLTERLPGDLAFARWVQGGPVSVPLGWIARPVFRLSENNILAIGVLAALALLARRGIIEAFAFVPVAGTTFLVPVAKTLVDRPRPSPDLVRVMAEQHTAGYPSAHVFFAVVMFGAMFHYAGPIFGPRRWMVLCARTLLVALVLDVSLSRIYRGAHWPSDVLGAYLLGGVALFVALRLYEGFVVPTVKRHARYSRLRPVEQPGPGQG